MKPKKAFFASQADLAFKREIGTYGVNIFDSGSLVGTTGLIGHNRRAEDNAGRGMVLIGGGASGRVRAARPLGTVISGPASNQGGGYSDHR